MALTSSDLFVRRLHHARPADDYRHADSTFVERSLFIPQRSVRRDDLAAAGVNRPQPAVVGSENDQRIVGKLLGNCFWDGVLEDVVEEIGEGRKEVVYGSLGCDHHGRNPDKVDKPTAPKSPDSSDRLAYFHTSRIRPLQPFAIKGVVWYQGESDAGRHAIFKHQFSSLVEEWSSGWNQGDFPWIYAQLAPFSGANGRRFPLVWDAQSQARDIPNSAMVVTLDHGVANDIHPPQKRPVGERFALAARRLAYHEKLTSSAPSFKSARVFNKAITLSFDQFDLQADELTCLTRGLHFHYDIPQWISRSFRHCHARNQ